MASTTTTGWRAALLALGLCAGIACAAPAAGVDAAAIRAQMHAAWDRPGQPLQTGPIVVEGDVAVAGWTQDTRGGRALLRREATGWITVLCAGDLLRSADGLIEAGVPPAAAAALAASVNTAEAGLAPERRARMDAFQGVVRLDAHGTHGAPEHRHGHGHDHGGTPP